MLWTACHAFVPYTSGDGSGDDDAALHPTKDAATNPEDGGRAETAPGDLTGGPDDLSRGDGPCEYRKHRSLTIRSSKVEGDLSDFPVMVRLAAADFRAIEGEMTDPEGDDLEFRAELFGARLSHEIEVYDTARELLVAWVKVPKLSDQADVVISIWYGNPCVTTPTANPADVWSNGYLAVYHLNESAVDGKSVTTHIDSASGYHGTQHGNQGREGKIAGGQFFDGVSDYIDASAISPQSLADLTVTAWYRSSADSASDDQYVFDFCQTKASGPCVGLNPTDDVGHEDRLRFHLTDTGTNFEAYYGTTDVVDEQWHFLVGVRGGGRVRVFVDGNEEANQADRQPGQTITITAPTTPTIGDSPGDGEQVHGLLDEVRISLVARSPQWLNTTYNNQVDPGAFYILGPPSE